MNAARRWRWPAAAVVVVLLSALLTAVLAGGRSSAGTLDPDSPSPDGGRALASLMRDRGFSVVAEHTTADALAAVRAAGDDGSTLFVTDARILSDRQLDDLAAQQVGRLVLVRPDGVGVLTLAPDEGFADGGRFTSSAEPGCSDPDALAAGKADIADGTSYSGSQGCYPVASGSALVTTKGPASQDTVLVGSSTFFRNDKLADHGNAALAMRLLGKHATIVWYLPDPADPEAVADTTPKSVWQVVPAGWRWGGLMLGISLLFLALWQSRRLGPVSVEKLPVVVRAAEAVEGRARLYERGQVRGGAADALRAATLSRLSARLGLGRGATPQDVAAAVAVRGGRPAVETASLLQQGTVPADDGQLVALADALDALEAEVGRL